MNIRGLTPQIAPIDSRLRAEAKDKVRLENSPERDANGRQQADDGEKKRHLSDEEFNQALKALTDNPHIASSELSIRVEVQADGRVVLIEDRTGKVVRRLSEADLWLVTREAERPTGKILDKAG